jgi:hypothetical protein
LILSVESLESGFLQRQRQEPCRMVGVSHRYNAPVLLLARAILVVVTIAAAFAPFEPTVIERWYSTGLYLRLERLLTPVSNVMPLAWLDVLSIVAMVWLIVRWWRALERRSEARWPRVRRMALDTVTAAAAVYLAFLVLWGFNYRRVPMTGRIAMEATPTSTEQVAQLGREVVARLNGTYGPAHHTGWKQPAWRNAALRAAYADVQRLLADVEPAEPGRLKQTLFGLFFRWTAVDGMVNPFGLEVLANPDLLPFERPFVAAHEWAHLAGYADESEANFVGWLTTVRADVASQYSGWLYLYWQIASELPPDERQRVAADLREGPRSDLSEIVKRLRRSDMPRLRRATWQVYDSFLKANRVEEGVRSYGAVVTLILRARFEDGWRPVRQAPSP